MKTLTTKYRNFALPRRSLSTALTLASLTINTSNPVLADETCVSPYLTRIEGQEEYIYVWTLGVEGLGDGSDKLVTVDVNPKSSNYGKADPQLFGRWTPRSSSWWLHR